MRVTRQLGVLLLALGCGGRVAEEEALPEQALPGPCVPMLGDRAARHACQHTSKGPFVEIVGLPNAELAEDMSQVHHTYRVVLHGEQPPFHGFVRFRTKRKGGQAFMHSSRAALRFFRGSESVPEIEALAPDCEHFDVATVMTAPSGGNFTVEITSDQRELAIFVEHLDAFTATGAWRERCEESP